MTLRSRSRFESFQGFEYRVPEGSQGFFGPRGWRKQKRLRRTAAQAAALAPLVGASASACANPAVLLKHPGVL